MDSAGLGSEQIVLGDFNLHHPSWGGTEVQADQEADEPILLTEEFEMKQVLLQGTITWRRANSQSTIDLIFMTPLLRESLMQCQTSKSLDCHSDHEPIRTLINLSTIQASQRLSRNWKQTDIKKLGDSLQSYLSASTCLPTLGMTLPLAVSIETIDNYVENLVQGIQKAILHATPFHNITPRSRPGFTKECKEAQKNAKRLKRRWRKLQTEEAWEAF